MFQSYSIQKYMKDNNLSFTDRFDFNEICRQFESIKGCLNFTDKIDKINALINSFKCWIQHYYRIEGKKNILIHLLI